MMSNSAESRLRAHFAQHNRRVIGLTIMTALVAAASWALLYFIAYWLTLLALTSAKSLEAQMPPDFSQLFFTVAAALCLFAWWLRRISPDEYPRDKKWLLEILLDFVLMVPRMTLAIGDTLRALQFLNRRELSLAVHLLQRIEQSQSALPVHAVPLEIPDDRAREKILFALQITELLDFRKKGAELLLGFRDEKARLLCQTFTRIQVR